MRRHLDRVYNIPLVCALVFFSSGSGFAQTARVYTRQAEGGGYHVLADNDHHVPVWMALDFTSLVNMTVDAELPFRTLLPPQSKEVRLLTLRPDDRSRRSSFRLTSRHALGDPRVQVRDLSHVYVFPFAHGTKRLLTQGFHGRFTHHGDNEYAVDFDMPVGTPVHAARGGLVVRVREDSNRGGPSAAHAQDANYVLIAHEDGTFGNYVHLRRNGALVSPGDVVEEGEHIAYSGNTGMSSGPHLHFDVRVPLETGGMTSIPIVFLDHDGNVTEPVEGLWYYARHRGGEEFAVAFGRDLTDERFASYLQPIPAGGRIELRTETLDSTIVLFLRNPTEAAHTVSVNLRLVGMRSSRGTSIEVFAPALSEVYVTLLNPIPGSSAMQYSASLRLAPSGQR